jgi:hypothetical protein
MQPIAIDALTESPIRCSIGQCFFGEGDRHDTPFATLQQLLWVLLYRLTTETGLFAMSTPRYQREYRREAPASAGFVLGFDNQIPQ